MKRSKFGVALFAVTAGVLGLGFASNAAAGASKKLPAALTTLTSYENPNTKDAATRHAGQLMAAHAQAGPGLAPLHLRLKNVKLLKFRREVAVLKENVVVKVQSPGKRRSFMSVELKF